MEIARKEGIQAQEVCSVCSQGSVLIDGQNFKKSGNISQLIQY